MNYSMKDLFHRAQRREGSLSSFSKKDVAAVYLLPQIDINNKNNKTKSII